MNVITQDFSGGCPIFEQPEGSSVAWGLLFIVGCNLTGNDEEIVCLS